MGKNFDDILDECIDRINRGETVEECLSHYPSYAAELEPALRMMTDVQSACSFTPSVEAKAVAKQRFQAELDNLERRRAEKQPAFTRWFRWSRAGAVVAAVLIIALGGYFGSKLLLPPNTGILQVCITDAPPQYEVSEVSVTIDSIEVHKAGEDEESGWITVIDKPGTFDLIAIGEKGGEMWGSAEIEATDYNGIRLFVSSATVTTIDGKKMTARVLNGKIKIPKHCLETFTVKAGGKTILTLDFVDVIESVNITPNGVIFTPVIHASAKKG